MSVAPVLAVRRAIVTHLRADSTVTSTAVGTRIYGERSPAQPTWPFVRYGVSDALPGHEITASLHIYSKADYTDDVNAIAEAIGNSLDDKVLDLGGDDKAYLSWAGQQLVGDSEEWHAVVTISARIPRECG